MSIHLTIKAVPGSGRCELTRDKNGTIKCYLKSQPERNEANHELVLFLAKKLGLTQDAVRITAGATSRTKQIFIVTTLTQDELLEKLGLEVQQTIC